MKPITLLILIGSSMLFMSACSKEEPAVNTADICKECSGESSQMPAFGKNFLKEWEKKKLHE